LKKPDGILSSPLLVAIALMGGILIATGTPYETYFQGAQFVHFLLRPATVAIAVPLVRHRGLVWANILPMLAALLAGAVTAVVSVTAVAAALGVPREILVSMAPKISDGRYRDGDQREHGRAGGRR
jgi:putative effector of murein hydrolase